MQCCLTILIMYIFSLTFMFCMQFKHLTVCILLQMTVSKMSFSSPLTLLFPFHDAENRAHFDIQNLSGWPALV